MSPRPTLHTYIDEELLRAPMTLDIVIDEVLAQWRMRLPPRSRHDDDPGRKISPSMKYYRQAARILMCVSML